jgi:N-methylhydantoinase A
MSPDTVTKSTTSATRVGIDTGGTFTDLIAAEGGVLRMAKTLSTPSDPARSTGEALTKAGIGGEGQVDTLVHGTTIATNALIERRGAAVGLITTLGFRDLLEIQRISRPRSFDLHWVKPSHLVPRRLVREVRERIAADASVSVPIDLDDVRRAAGELVEQGVEAIAISFLFSFLNSDHERQARAAVNDQFPELEVSISSEVFGQWREYERTSTCVIDAFLKPTVARYAAELSELGRERGIGDLLVMRSNGGVMTPAGAREKPISMVRSGPAGGVIATSYVAKLVQFANLIIADMGGTSFDTGLVRAGEPALTTFSELEWGIPIAVPMVDVRSVGAGGGSVAWVDAAGIMRVGPESAGADPGPACYGRGGERATVTDANLVLGRLPHDLPLAGDLALDVEASERVIAALAAELERDPKEVALGILRIADNNMAQAVRLVTIDRGYDPREFALMAFGGAGPLHASAIARALSMRDVVVPIFPGAFSAFGALIADTRFDYMRTSVMAARSADLARIQSIYADLEDQAARDLAREGIVAAPTLVRTVELRYSGQNWELEVPLEGEPSAESIDAVKRRFHAEHDAHFGWSLPDGDLELVNFKLAAIAARATPELPELQTGPLPEPVSSRGVTFDDGETHDSTPVYWRADLCAENRIEGPALIAEPDATVLLAPGDRLEVDSFGNLIITVGGPTA